MRTHQILFSCMLLLAAIGLHAQPKLFVGPNEPLGEGKGIHPGRVVWVHNPGVAKWDLETGLWVEDRWNNQDKADDMIRGAVTQLAGKKNVKKA